MGRNLKPYRVDSVPAFVELVCRLRQRWSTRDGEHLNPWFRGQSNESWGLVPNIYRLKIDHRESEIRASYKRHGSLLITERVPSGEWEWYCLMQHYGAPTRLLDWSDGALLALYFALTPRRTGRPQVSTDAAVWMLDPYWLNTEAAGIDHILTTDGDESTLKGYLPSGEGEKLSQAYPVALNPPHVARRFGVQRSRFTVHGTVKEGLLEVGGRDEDRRLLKIVIPAAAVERMRNDLATCGVWDSIVFPDLEGLSREVIRDWTDTWTPD